MWVPNVCARRAPQPLLQVSLQKMRLVTRVASKHCLYDVGAGRSRVVEEIKKAHLVSRLVARIACGAYSRQREAVTSQPSLSVEVYGWGRNPDRGFSVFIVNVGRIVRSDGLSGWCISLRFDMWVLCFPYVTDIVVGF